EAPQGRERVVADRARRLPHEVAAEEQPVVEPVALIRRELRRPRAARAPALRDLVAGAELVQDARRDQVERLGKGRADLVGEAAEGDAELGARLAVDRAEVVPAYRQ